jgi:hypothetical protein
VATVTIGPTQTSGKRTIADANALTLAAGDVVQFESIDESGPFTAPTRLQARAGVTYRSLDFGHKWGLQGLGGVDLAGVNDVTIEDFLGDGQQLSGSLGILSTGSTSSLRLTLDRYELCNYENSALRAQHGQRTNFEGTGSIAGPDDVGWVMRNGYHHDNAFGVFGGGHVSDCELHGFGAVLDRVVFRNTGLLDHALYPDARGLRMNDVQFDKCGTSSTTAFTFRCGDQLAYRLYFDGCINPVAYFPYDKTGLGGIFALYGAVFRGCSAPGGGALIFIDDANGETGAFHQVADQDAVLAGITILDSTTGGQVLDFRDFTAVAGRNVKLRNIAMGKNVTVPFAAGYTAGKLDSDYNAYPNGGKPAGETHSIAPSTLTVSEATLLPTSGSALISAGTTSVDANYTPRKPDIGFQGYPAPPSAATPVAEIMAPTLLTKTSSATPSGTLGTTPAPGDIVVYALGFNQNNLGDLTVTPPSGFNLDVSRSVTDRVGLYATTRKWVSGDALALPAWHLQDSVPADQARNCEVWAAIYRGQDGTTAIPTGGAVQGGNTAGQTAGATAATTIATPRPGSALVGFAVGKPGQTAPTHSLDTATSTPSGTTAGDRWNKRDEQLQGTANGSSAITMSAYSGVLDATHAEQAKLAVLFSVAAQWAAVAIEIQPPVGGGTADTTPPDAPANLQLESVTATSIVVKADPTDYGTVSGGGGGGGGGGGAGWTDPGPPMQWYKFTQDGGLRPSPTSRDPSAAVGPRAADYYSNLSLRQTLRGAAQPASAVTYYPRSLGLNILAIDFSDPAHFKVTLDAAPPPGSGLGLWQVGKVVQVRDASSTGGSAGAFKPKKPNGQYTIQSISGQIVTFNTGANTTSGTYDPDSGYAILDELKRTEAVSMIDVTETSIASAGDSHGPLFLPLDPNPATPKNTPTNPWVLQPGFTNYLSIAGNVSSLDNGGAASLNILIPPWFDVINAGADYAANGMFADAQLLNPFCHIEFANCNLFVQDGMGAYGITGGKPGSTPAYSAPLGTANLVIPVGEAIGWGGCSGVVRGLMNQDFCYDGNKWGNGAKNLVWEYCTNFRMRNLVVSGGGHTDGYQVWWLENDGLGPWTDDTGRLWARRPTWYRCYFEAGGNAMLFLNSAQTGHVSPPVIKSTYALECIAGTGNKFLLTAGCHDAGAIRCLVNGVPKDAGTPPMVGVRPQPHDYGDNDQVLPCSQTSTGSGSWHPCPSGLLWWPDPGGPNAADANLSVLEDGSTVPIDRFNDAGTTPCTAGVCFDFADLPT